MWKNLAGNYINVQYTAQVIELDRKDNICPKGTHEKTTIMCLLGQNGMKIAIQKK